MAYGDWFDELMELGNKIDGIYATSPYTYPKEKYYQWAYAHTPDHIADILVAMWEGKKRGVIAALLLQCYFMSQ